MATALLGLGSNLGDRAAALDKAIELLKATPQIRLTAVSSYRSSKSAGGPDGQSDFLNAAVLLETSLSPEELLHTLLRAEDEIGRIRRERWGPRAIDLDLLLYDRLEMKTTVLELPHPRMCFRRFVLEPAAEIAAEMVWPVNGWTVNELLLHLGSTARYIAVGCVQEDFERIIEPIRIASNCRVVNKFRHESALEQLLGKDGLHPSCDWVPPDHWMEQVLALECQRNADSIARKTWPQNQIWTLSDFWPEWFFDFAANRLNKIDTSKSCEVLDKLQDYRSEAQQPRLVIILDDGDGALASLHAEVKQLCRRSGSPPSLWLSSDDPEQVVREVLAAMRAME